MNIFNVKKFSLLLIISASLISLSLVAQQGQQDQQNQDVPVITQTSQVAASTPTTPPAPQPLTTPVKPELPKVAFLIGGTVNFFSPTAAFYNSLGNIQVEAGIEVVISKNLLIGFGLANIHPQDSIVFGGGIAGLVVQKLVGLPQPTQSTPLVYNLGIDLYVDYYFLPANNIVAPFVESGIGTSLLVAPNGVVSTVAYVTLGPGLAVTLDLFQIFLKVNGYVNFYTASLNASWTVGTTLGVKFLLY